MKLFTITILLSFLMSGFTFAQAAELNIPPRSFSEKSVITSGGSSTPFFQVCWISNGDFCPRYDEKFLGIVHQIYLIMIQIKELKASLIFNKIRIKNYDNFPPSPATNGKLD